MNDAQLTIGVNFSGRQDQNIPYNYKHFIW